MENQTSVLRWPLCPASGRARARDRPPRHDARLVSACRVDQSARPSDGPRHHVGARLAGGAPLELGPVPLRVGPALPMEIRHVQSSPMS